jgi:hypothetical protein
MLPASLLVPRRSEANRCSRPARTENTDWNATLATPSILRPAGISDVLAARRTGAGEDELADGTGVLGHKRLGDEAERLDEGCRVVCHRLDAVGDPAARGAEAAVVEGVEGNDVVVLSDQVDDARVPVVEVCGEMDEEDDGNPALRPRYAVGECDPTRGDRPRWRVLVRSDEGGPSKGVGYLSLMTTLPLRAPARRRRGPRWFARSERRGRRPDG